MRYGSVCSGIEAATVAWHPLGWTPAFFSEIEAFPRTVLQHHYNDTPLHGDFTTIGESDYGSIDLLVGGTPCQSFSVAGLRGGLGDDRGNLALEFLRLAQRKRPAWVVWENVPGVLSSNGGRDFGSILGGLAELGYGFAYRILDAQYFGVAQRRRRVFVVGYFGDWRPAAAVLFERHSLQGHPAPRREKRQTAPTIPSRSTGGGGLGTDFDCDGGLIHAPEISPALKSRDHKGPSSDGDGDGSPLIAHSLRAEHDASEDGTGRGTPLVPVAFDCKGTEVQFSTDNLHPTLRSMGHRNSHSNAGGHAAVAYDMRGREGGAQFEGPHDTANLRAASGGSSRSYIASHAVRRLTPRECERLQGFPDDYTLIPLYNKKPTDVLRYSADGPRYKALGNSMAVPVMRWIGARIAAVDALDLRDKP